MTVGSEQVRLYERILSTARDHMSFVDRDYIHRAVNDAYLRAHQRHREEVVGHPVAELMGTEYFEGVVRPELDRCLRGEEVRFQSWVDLPALGRRCMDVVCHPFAETDGAISGVVMHARDITDQKETEEELQHRLRLEAVIGSISTLFINLPASEIDEAINQALKQIGEFAGADRSYVFQFRDHMSKIDDTHEWCAEGAMPRIARLRSLPSAVLPYAAGHALRREVMHVPRVADLPPEPSAEKEEWERTGTKSVVIVPMVCGQDVIGVLGFDSVREEKTWSEDTISLLRLAGEVIANALVRQRAEAERERLIADLQAQRALMEAILQQMPSGVIIAEAPSGKFVSTNQRAAEILHLPTLKAEAVEEYAQFEGYRPDGRAYEEGDWPLARAVRGGEVVRDEEIIFNRRDGTQTILNVSAGPIRDREGRIVAAAVVYNDIADRKRTEEDRLRYYQERTRQTRLLETILRSTSSMLAYLDRDLRFVEINQAFSRVSGWTREEILGLTLPEIRPGDDELTEMVRRVRDTGESAERQDFPLVLARRPGLGVRYLDLSIAAIPGDGGKTEGIVMSASDVTEQVQAQERAIEVERGRARLSEMMLLEVNHRMKNNLAMVAGFLELQARDAAWEGAAEALMAAVARMRSIAAVHDQLYERRREEVELLDAMHRIVRIGCDALCKQECEASVEGDVVHYGMKGATSLCIVGNELVTNAVKYGAPTAGGKLVVRVGVGVEQGQLSLTVWNSGNPVPADFEPTAQRGRGLQLVGEIVCGQYGGTLTLTPHQGGTMAEVRIDDTQLRDSP